MIVQVPEGQLPEERTVNAVEAILDVLYGYYLRAPVFFWVAVGLIAWTIAWMFWSRRGSK